MGGGKPAFVNGSENCLKGHYKEEILRNRSTYINFIKLEYIATRQRKTSCTRTFHTLCSWPTQTGDCKDHCILWCDVDWYKSTKLSKEGTAFIFRAKVKIKSTAWENSARIYGVMRRLKEILTSYIQYIKLKYSYITKGTQVTLRSRIVISNLIVNEASQEVSTCIPWVYCSLDYHNTSLINKYFLH